jgi:hypothetical protein
MNQQQQFTEDQIARYNRLKDHYSQVVRSSDKGMQRRILGILKNKFNRRDFNQPLINKEKSVDES